MARTKAYTRSPSSSAYLAASAVATVLALAPQSAAADDNGISFWLPGIFGSLAAAPLQPGFSFDRTRPANIGIGHGALDGGLGCTYFNPQTGNEFSAVASFTYNFENPYTDYQSGVDFHLDWATSKFLTKQFQIGVVGFVYDQVSCSMAGAPSMTAKMAMASAASV